ncbi:MAG TPA: hypothetical protein VGK19_19800 [Capsulimonadaceae bacterium]
MLTHKRAAAMPALLLIGALAASDLTAAHADLTITSKISASGLPGQPGTPAAPPRQPGNGPQQPAAPGAPGAPNAAQPRQGGPTGQPPSAVPKFPLVVTTYYKEGYARTDVKDGPITLFNAKRGHVYVLNPVDKTYYIKDTPTTGRSRMGTLTVDSKLTLTKQDPAVAANVATVAGAKATKYAVGGTVAVSFKRNADATPRASGDNAAPPPPADGAAPPPPADGAAPPPPTGGEPPAAGTTPGGAGGNRQGRGGNGFSMTTDVSGEIWASDSVKLPTVDPFLLDPLVNELSFNGGGGRRGGGASLTKPLLDQLLELKAIPLKSKLTVSMTNPFNQQKVAITTTFDVVSVNSTSLPDAMFLVPEDYTEVDPPQQGWGGPGGPGGDNGGGNRRGRRNGGGAAPGQDL